MATDFETFEGGVIVRQADGRFQSAKTPEGFTDLAFRNAIAAYDTAYRTQGRLPSVDEVYKVFPKLPKVTYSTLLLTPEFKQALHYRGIELDSEAGLSLEQSMALLKLTDPTDRRSTSTKLKEMGIPMPKFQAWMKQPMFLASYRERSEKGLAEAIPMVLQRLVGNAEASDQRAIEKVLEITGRWNPAQQQVEDAKTVVLAVVEAVIKHVSDPDVRKEIMADISLVAGTLGALNVNRSLEA